MIAYVERESDPKCPRSPDQKGHGNKNKGVAPNIVSVHMADNAQSLEILRSLFL